VTKYTLFNQLLSLIDRNTFNKAVDKYDTDKFNKGINSWTHLVSMLFMQLADATSCRDISLGLKSAQGDLNHLGVTKAPCKSSISYINQHRSYKLFEQLYYDLLEKYEPSLQRRRKYASRLKRSIYIMDASVIPLCLSLFDWAKFRTTKGGIKLHTVLDYDTGLPCYNCISDGGEHESQMAKATIFPTGSVLVVDRGYVDYSWLFNLDSSGVFFVTRLKTSSVHEVTEIYDIDEKHPHIIGDENIEFKTTKGSEDYPKTIRVVKVYDAENDQYLELLTNNFTWTADTISQLYKARWDVETFFKHLKQRFEVKSFVGTSANAVRIQMWVSMICMLLIRYLERKAKFKWHFSNLVVFIRIHLYVKLNLWEWIDNPVAKQNNSPPIYVNLFDAQ